MRKLKNGDTISTTYGDTAVIVSIGEHDDELTKLDRPIKIGIYTDGKDCILPFIPTSELYDILEY